MEILELKLLVKSVKERVEKLRTCRESRHEQPFWVWDNYRTGNGQSPDVYISTCDDPFLCVTTIHSVLLRGISTGVGR